MRRFMLVLAGVLLGLPAFSGPASAAGCSSTAAATYRHTFDGESGTATITAVQPLCAGPSQTFSLTSYTATTGDSAYPQFVYAADHATIDARHRSVRLSVAVPGCYTQVDLTFGTAVLDQYAPDPTTELGSATGVGHRSTGPPGGYHGGEAACDAEPTVSFTSACDGTFRATLANSADANVAAVFSYRGRLIHVAPGRSTTVTGPEKGTMSIRDSSLTTNVSTWTAPTTDWAQPGSGCTQTAPAGSAPPTVPAASAASPVLAATLSASSAPADGPRFTAASAAAPPSLAPAATASAAGPATGPSFGSIAVVTFGLVMIGGGLILLYRVIFRTRNA